MNYKLRRFIETTLPMITLFGIVVVLMTKFVGVIFGLWAVTIFTIIDVVMTKRRDIYPTYIKYDNRCFLTLTELIDYVKKRK